MIFIWTIFIRFPDYACKKKTGGFFSRLARTSRHPLLPILQFTMTSTSKMLAESLKSTRRRFHSSVDRVRYTVLYYVLLKTIHRGPVNSCNPPVSPFDNGLSLIEVILRDCDPLQLVGSSWRHMRKRTTLWNRKVEGTWGKGCNIQAYCKTWSRNLDNLLSNFRCRGCIETAMLSTDSEN